MEVRSFKSSGRKHCTGLSVASRLSRSSIGGISPGSHQHRHMVVSLPLFYVELDLDLGPEAFHSLLLIPATDIKLDAPWDAFPRGEFVHEFRKGRVGRRVPALHPAVLVGDGMEAHVGRQRRGGRQ